MRTESEQTFSLAELTEHVVDALGQLGIVGVGDARVNARPDARTVRYYQGLGLIDRPKTRGRRARYGRRQFLQLVAIKALQSRRLPLSEIQARLYGLKDAELEQIVRAAAVRPE
ncbi:MAG: MerR family transcriptional regulator, partial [Planctomycetota bacterium]